MVKWKKRRNKQQKLTSNSKDFDRWWCCALGAIMTLGSPFLHSVPWHNRPAHTQRGDSSLPGHQPGQPGLPAHPAAGWGRAWHLQQGQRNAALQRWEAVFPGMLSSTFWQHQGRAEGSLVAWGWNSAITSCFLPPFLLPSISYAWPAMLQPLFSSASELGLVSALRGGMWC